MYWCCGTCWTSLHSARMDMVKFCPLLRDPKHFLNFSTVPLSEFAMSEWGAPLKCCYLTWQEQDCRQSPETHCVSGAQTDCGIASLCESSPLPAPLCSHSLMALSDSPLINWAVTVAKRYIRSYVTRVGQNLLYSRAKCYNDSEWLCL